MSAEEIVQPSEPVRPMWFSWRAVAFLLMTTWVALIWGQARLLDQDELLVLWTDSLGSLRQVVQVQMHTPISLDPMGYHGLVHLALKLVGDAGGEVFALRLVSLVGFLLMQICLYVFVRRIASENVAIFAMAFPAVTATMFYVVEARPYGMLLGLFALAMVSWQSAVRKGNAGERRVGALVTLAVSIALALNTHYYGVLLLAPMAAAVCWGAWLRRRIDWPLFAAVIAGMAGMVFTLPFARAAAAYKKHYYSSGNTSLHAVTQAYRSLFVDYTTFPMWLQKVMAVLFVVLVALVVWGFVRQLRRKELPVLSEEVVFLVTLSALPIFGFAMAVVMHSYEVRYVLGALVGITPIVAIALAPLLRGVNAGRLAGAVMLVAVAAVGMARTSVEQKASAAEMAELQVSPLQKAAVMATKTQLLYVQNFGRFAVASYYMPDAELRSRLALVYSSAEEIKWRGRDTNSLTAIYMRSFSPLKTVAWEQMETEPGEHVMVLYHTGWDWTDYALKGSSAVVMPMGGAMGGDMAGVEFKR